MVELTQLVQALAEGRMQGLDPELLQRSWERPLSTDPLLLEPRPEPLIGQLFARLAVGQPTFLGNPAWSEREQQLAREMTATVPGDRPWIGIPTGGTSGRLRFAVHTPDTLTAAVEGLQTVDWLGNRLDSWCTLPLFHVSGLMQLWRSLHSGCRFRWQAYKELEGAIASGEPLPDAAGYAISLVPTQLQRLLPQGVDWLRRCRVIFLGGAPAWPTLLTRARDLDLPLAPCYGMSETAAMVTLLAPQAFRAGAEGVGPPLPHVTLTLDPAGALALRSPALALGYWEAPGQLEPLAPEGQPFRSDDWGEWTPAGLRLWGRASDKILSGGENVWAGEVEAQIRATGLVTDVVVLGVPDADWGQRVAAVVVLASGVQLPELQAALRSRLASYKCPKQWLCLTTLPRNAQGKLSRQVLTLMIRPASAGSG